MTNSTTFPGEINIPSNTTYKIGGNIVQVLADSDAISVTTGDPGTNASVTLGGNASAATLAFTIPRGDAGNTGNNGNNGNQGPQGNQGPAGNQGNAGNQGPAGGGTYHVNGKIEANGYCRSNGYQYLENAGGARTFYANYNTYGNGASYNNAIGWYIYYQARMGGIMVRSDERSKEDIKTLDTEKALKKINNIRPVSYLHKSNHNFSLGFIAQEVKNEIPAAVDDEQLDFVENIDILGNFTNKRSFIRDDGAACVQYTFVFKDETFPSNVKFENSEWLRFKVRDGKDSQVENDFTALYVRQYCGEPQPNSLDVLIDDDPVEGITVDDSLDHLLVGTRVNDAHSVNYNEVFTVLTASVKEIDKQRLLDKARLEVLESKIKEKEA
tara:strand:+ start:17972 stop:19120 length:1149 start_codon:yes stop_codon:yes gene_type:complete